MAISGSIQFQGGSGYVTPNQPLQATLTLLNTGTSVVNVTSLQTYLVAANGLPSTGGVVTQPSTIGKVLAIQPNGGTLTASFGLILQTPLGNAQTGLAQGGAATSAVTLGVTAYTDDGSVTNVTEALTPTQLGAAAPVAGSLQYSSPLSLAYLYW